MCSNYQDENSWIEIIEEDLSDENKEILNKIDDIDIIKFRLHKGCINIGVNYVGEKAQNKLIEIASQLKMQDVPKRATTDTESALIQSGYYKLIKNPSYDPKKLDDLDYNEPFMIKVLDYSKIDKPVDTILKDEGYIKVQSEGRIYISDYHYQKHLKYLEYQNKLNIITNNKG